MKAQDSLLHALTDVGDDLVEEAGHLTFPASPLRRILPLAACCAFILGAALAIQTWKPSLEAQIILPDSEDTAQEVLPSAEDAPATEVPETTGSVYILKLDDEIYGARQAVDFEGNVLVEVEHGELYLLKDESTGEALAICARDNLEDAEIASPIDLYDLEGTYLTTIEALRISCTGNVIQVNTGEEYRYFSRTDHALLASGFEDADLRGDFVLSFDLDTGMCCLFDTSGSMTATFRTERYDGRLLEWDGKHYFVITDEQGREGLMDTSGAWVLEPAWDGVTAMALGQAVVSLDGKYQVIDLDSKEILFTWLYHIYQIHAEGYVVETEDGWQQALDLAGQPVSDPAFRIELLDDEGDGQVELIQEVQTDNQLAVYRRTDGTLVREVSFQFGELYQLSARTATFRKENGNLEWIIDVETGEKIYLAHEYFYLEIIDDYDEAILCCGSYRDENNNLRTDILNEYGEVILPDVLGVVGIQHLGDGVFAALRNGRRALVRLDGTILYESDVPVGYTMQIDPEAIPTYACYLL